MGEYVVKIPIFFYFLFSLCMCFVLFWVFWLLDSMGRFIIVSMDSTWGWVEGRPTSHTSSVVSCIMERTQTLTWGKLIVDYHLALPILLIQLQIFNTIAGIIITFFTDVNVHIQKLNFLVNSHCFYGKFRQYNTRIHAEWMAYEKLGASWFPSVTSLILRTELGRNMDWKSIIFERWLLQAPFAILIRKVIYMISKASPLQWWK